MAGTRLHKLSTPLVNKFARWSPYNFYNEGSIVWDLDSENNITVFLCLQDHKSYDSDETMYARLTDIRRRSGLFPTKHNPENSLSNLNLWAKWLTTAITDSDEYTFASLQNKISHHREAIDSDEAIIGTFVNKLKTLLAGALSIESLDSDIKAIDSDIVLVQTRPAFSFVDSEAVNRQTLGWDSDRLNTIPNIRSLNALGPDTVGNVPIVLTKVITGTLDERPDSETNGAIFVVRNDSDSEFNGYSYIYDVDTWRFFVYPDRDKNDARYLQTNGSALTGPLIVLEPTLDNHIVTKKYVEDNVKDIKQSAFLVGDSDSVLDLDSMDSENFIVSREQPILRFYDKINTYVVGGYVDSYSFSKPLNATIDANGDLVVTTQYFSNSIRGTLEFFRNGIPHSFVSDSDFNVTFDTYGTGVMGGFRLVNSLQQSFKLSFVTPFDVSRNYLLKFTTDRGDEETLTKTAGSLLWTANAENFDFGTY